MIRINTLNRCGKTLTLELMGYINKVEVDGRVEAKKTTKLP